VEKGHKELGERQERERLDRKGKEVQESKEKRKDRKWKEDLGNGETRKEETGKKGTKAGEVNISERKRRWEGGGVLKGRINETDFFYFLMCKSVRQMILASNSRRIFAMENRLTAIKDAGSR
jgi:hypothetical protein